jgi:hypothetical protein
MSLAPDFRASAPPSDTSAHLNEKQRPPERVSQADVAEGRDTAMSGQSDLIAAMVRSTISSVPIPDGEAAPPSLLQRQTRRISLDAPGRSGPASFSVGI